MKIAEFDQTKFRAKLKAGKTRLQTWFTNDKDESRGAYYAYVKRL